MANGVEENVFLVNAPAGSGKTTWIRQQVEHYLLNNPKDNVLCITYTNRAAEELGKDLDNNRVYFGTIHSFINDFIGSFFSHNSLIDLYWEVYKDEISKRIENVEQNSNWEESNEKYKEKYGCLDLKTVRANIKAISYNEAPFNFLYRGALSHDDLISFTKLAVDQFPVIKKKIADKYQLIFIDEYQDTAEDVFSIFYTSVIGKKSKLYLLGDKMQQIYQNYHGEFEEQFKTFNRSIHLSVNYRTTPKIVEILNAIYNNENLKQYPYEKSCNDVMAFAPQVLIVSDIEKSIAKFRQKYKDALILYLSNKSRFYSIGAGGLYDAYTGMKKYEFGKKYNAVDILTKEEIRINDSLLSFLFMADELIREYMQGWYGMVLRTIRKYHAYYISEKFIIRTHSDKAIIKNRLEIFANSYNKVSATIDEFLKSCVKNNCIREEFFLNITEDLDYHRVKEVKIREVRALVDYLKDPTVSTQHGVKGESHDTVVFVAENSYRTPIVHMSKFFELWSNINVTLSEFDDFYYKYSRMIQKIETEIGMKGSELKADTYKLLANKINSILEKFIFENRTNPYYIQLLKDKMDKYYEKQNATNVKNCLKVGTVYGPLCAYRLFYVGCSRARKNLTIIIDRKDIMEFELELRDKLTKIGFNVL